MRGCLDPSQGRFERLWAILEGRFRCNSFQILDHGFFYGVNVRVQGPAEGEARSEPASASCRRSPGTRCYAAVLP